MTAVFIRPYLDGGSARHGHDHKVHLSIRKHPIFVRCGDDFLQGHFFHWCPNFRREIGQYLERSFEARRFVHCSGTRCGYKSPTVNFVNGKRTFTAIIERTARDVCRVHAIERDSQIVQAAHTAVILSSG